MKNAAVLVLVALVSGAAGYVIRGKATPPPKPPAHDVTDAPEVAPAGTEAPRLPADYQTLKNHLALCMAFHPSESEQDKQLAMCRADLAVYRGPRPTLPDCYDFIDFAPTYDRELGEADPSPETLERAKAMTPESCVPVLTWSSRAIRQQGSCLKGDAPPGFKERYGRPIGERPLVKACASDPLHRDAFNAWLRREEDRVREMGHPIQNRVRMTPDGGVFVDVPSSLPY